MPSAQDGEDSSDQAAAFAAGNFEDVALEAAQFGAFDASVKLAQQGAASQIIADDQVVAGGEECGSVRHINVAAVAKQANLQPLLGQGLAEERATELAAAIIQGDDLIAAD